MNSAFKTWSVRITLRNKINTVIIGAGKAGKILLNDFQNPQYDKFRLIGFIDDDESKNGKAIGKKLVIGSTKDIPNITEEKLVGLYIIAIPSASGETIQRIVDIILRTKAEYMIVPTLFRNLAINHHATGCNKI